MNKKDNTSKKSTTKSKAKNKQTKPSKSTTTNQKLSPIEKELLECAKQCQPVLLFGEDSIGRKDLIVKIHEMNGGIDKTAEKFYRVGNGEKLFPYNKEKFEPLQKKDEKITYCLSSTPETRQDIDCRSMSGEEVYKKLVSSEIKQNDMYVYMGKVPKGLLFAYKGSIFLNNLKCKNDKDDDYYSRLSKIIEEGKTKKYVENNTTYTWLVVYADKPNNFPNDFLEQFVPISLHGEVEEKKIEGFAADTRQTSNYEFFLGGNMWTLTYEGKTIHFQDSVGLKYIHFLLRNPDRKFYILDLVSETKKSKPSKGIYNKMSKEEQKGQLIEESVYKGLTKNTGDVLDKEGIQLLKECYDDLESELNNEEIPPSDKRTLEIEKEMEEIRKSLTAGRDKYGQPRKFPDEAEKARKSVSKAYNKSLKKIEDDHPALLTHFKNTLKIGIYCSYKPEKPIPWKL